MIYVGIDIAKKKHFAFVMSCDGEILVEAFGFTNDHSGFALFLSNISSYDKTKILIGLEPTAHYAENIVSFLFDLDYHICIINPIQTPVCVNQILEKLKPIK